MKKLLIIAGATATGKSSLAIKAAKLLDTGVISCDSMQIYKDMNIGTAKEHAEVLNAVPHYMIDIVSPSCDFSVAEYQKTVDGIIEKTFNNGKTPIICGGTGLYVEAVIYPLNFSGTDRNSELREILNAEYDEFGGEYMLEKLKKFDCEAAEKLHFNDKKRIVRALEICQTTGKKINSELKTPRYDYIMVGLNADREILYNKINDRVEKMFESGLLNEVENIIKKGVNFEAQSMQAIGYKEFKQYFSGETTLAEVKELIKKNTRNYAKRQITWFKRYKDIKWFDISDTENALNFIKENFLEK